MAVQTMNTDMIPKLKSCIENLNVIKGELIKGFEETEEICNESGSQKLIASVKSAGEGVQTLVSTANELSESLQMMLKQYEKLQAAL